MTFLFVTLLLGWLNQFSFMSKLAWQLGTVVSIVPETPHVKTFTLSLPH